MSMHFCPEFESGSKHYARVFDIQVVIYESVKHVFSFDIFGSALPICF